MNNEIPAIIDFSYFQLDNSSHRRSKRVVHKASNHRYHIAAAMDQSDDSSSRSDSEPDYLESSGSEFKPGVDGDITAEDEDDNAYVSDSDASEIFPFSSPLPFRSDEGQILTCPATMITTDTTTLPSNIETVEYENEEVPSTSAIQSSKQDKIIVMSTSNTTQGRKWDKKNFCYYCQAPQTKLPRHMESRHADETEIIQLGLARNKEERQKLLCKLRNLGNHKHNSSVKRSREGTLIVAYRPTHEDANLDAYSPCR
jgi:hypothetical protein